MPRVRVMTRDDIPACVTIGCSAFIDDTFFGWIAPRRYEHPDGWRQYILEGFQKRLLSPGGWFVVCVEDLPSGGEEILGFGMWQRQCMDPKTSPYAHSPFLRSNTSVTDWINRQLLQVELAYNRNVVGNKAVDAKVAAMFAGSPGAPVFASLNDRWYLGNLGVSPQHQRKGVGALIVRWGLDRSREEAEMLGLPPVPAALIASPMGQGLYRKNGFKAVAWLGEDMPRAAPAMVWDNTGRSTRLVRDGDVKVTQAGNPLEAIFVGSEEDKAAQAAEISGRGSVEVGLGTVEEQNENVVAAAAEIAG